MISQAALEIAQAETEAARLVSNGNLFTRIWLGVRAGFALGRDPNDTSQVFRMVIAFDYDRLERMRARMETSETGRALLRERPAIDSKSVDFAALRALPKDTLGGGYARLLEKAKLDPDLFQPPTVLGPELAYVSQRSRQTHDLWHVLTGLDTDVPGEIMLQAFTWGQFQSRTSRWIAVFGTLHYGFRYPQLWRDIRGWYTAGKRAEFLLAVPWEKLWNEPVAALRERFGIAPVSAA
jgi:ubiquinone biosynthesis protein COQ4